MTSEILERLQLSFAAAMSALPRELSSYILEGISNSSPEERPLIRALYAAMPQSDIADYPFETYRGFAAHALLLLKKMRWKVPEELFLNYVLHYRVNNEPIENCRFVFYLELWERTAGLSMREAALETNYWCLEHATYQTTDERTLSPLSMLKSCYGRCGEQSTFTVTALRSIGLPARQVYAPRWSHCDDNHAWVEVWCDGVWQYLGACEPEPVLCRGWFTAAASRAVMIHSRLLCFFTCEQIFERDGRTILIGVTPSYADTRPLTVRCGAPGVTVRLEVLNFAEFFPIATLVSDEQGEVHATVGLGSIHLHAVRGGLLCEALIDTRETGDITLDFSAPLLGENIDFFAPSDNPRAAPEVGRDTKAAHSARFAACTAARKALAMSNPPKDERAADAVLNAPAVEALLRQGGLYEKLVGSLSKKDLLDCDARVLEEHVQFAQPFAGSFPEDVFVHYLLCPRIRFEAITAYRSAIARYFSWEALLDFHRNPMLVWQFVQSLKSRPELEYSTLVTSPAGMLKLLCGSELSKKTLFVAICRTIGVPARLSPVDAAAQYYLDGAFVPVLPAEISDTVPLTLISETDTVWGYSANWSLARLSDGVYQTLDLSCAVWENGRCTIALCPGEYRLITTNRSLNGSQFARQYRFSLPETRELSIAPREIKLAEMLECVKLPDFTLYELGGEAVSSESLLAGGRRLLLWLEESREPTEHILNELIALCERFSALSITFVLGSREAALDSTVQKAVSLLPQINVLVDGGLSHAEALARRMYVDPEKRPLIILTDDSGNGLYACCGYSVGTGELLLKIAEM